MPNLESLQTNPDADISTLQCLKRFDFIRTGYLIYDKNPRGQAASKLDEDLPCIKT